jgi:hypothetical protein
MRSSPTRPVLRKVHIIFAWHINTVQPQFRSGIASKDAACVEAAKQVVHMVRAHVHACHMSLQSPFVLCGWWLQMSEPHSDSRAAPGSISWELTNPVLWEQVLNERQTR